MIRGDLSGRFRWVILAVGLAVLSLTGNLRADGREIPATLHAQVDAAIAKVRPALVRIRVVSAEFRQGREIKVQEVGSGVIISKDGYIITNHHVAGHATRLFCTLWDHEEIEAKLVATDPLTDISVIKLKPDRPRQFTPAVFGDSSKMRVGDYVLAMGSPMALSQSVTLGIISNTEMIMPRFWGSLASFKLDGEDVGALVRWIGHDAAIYGGNSGGPLVNLKGEVIGINEISFGLGGAIPGNLAHRVAEQLIAKGKVVRSWLGLNVQPRLEHLDEKHGVLIGGVVKDSPASKAGLRAGDLLVRLNGVQTDVRFNEQMPDFMRLETSLPIGRQISAVVQRDGKELTVHLTPIERGVVYPKQHELKDWGLTARNLSPFIAREMKRDSLDGVLVTSVRPGGPAGEAKPSLAPGDVIVEVHGAPIKNVEDLEALTRRLTAHESDPVPVVATFERKADRYLAVVRVGIQELRDPGLEVTKAWLPVETQVISRDIARQLHEPGLKGFYITRVYPDTTAARAGFKPGDFIVAVDGEKLTATGGEYADELSALIRQYDIGKTVELTILRNRKKLTVPVQLVRSPRLQREMKKYRNEEFEFTARNVSFFDDADRQWNRQQKGALVEDVKSGSWAQLGMLYVGDLILEVDGHSIKNIDDLRQQMERIAAARESVVVMKVLRGIHTLYLEMEPNWKH